MTYKKVINNSPLPNKKKKVSSLSAKSLGYETELISNDIQRSSTPRDLSFLMLDCENDFPLNGFNFAYSKIIILFFFGLKRLLLIVDFNWDIRNSGFKLPPLCW